MKDAGLKVFDLSEQQSSRGETIRDKMNLNAHDYSQIPSQQIYPKYTKINNPIESPAKSDRSCDTEKISTGGRSSSSNRNKSKLYDDAMHRLQKQEVLTILAD